MLVFYSFERWLRILIAAIGGFAVISEAVLIVLDSMRYDWSSHHNRRLFEYIMLCNIVILAAIAPTLNYILRDGFLARSLYEKERVAAYLLLVIFTLIRVREKKYRLLLNLIVIAPLLPFFQGFLGKWFFAYLTIVLLYFNGRGVVYSVRNYQALNREISVRSIKEAMDTLPSGILFASIDGNILLTNQKMQELMIEITGDVSRDIYHWFSKLRQMGYRSGNLMMTDSEMVIKLSSDEYWHFVRDKLNIDGKDYWQLVAADISEQWNLIRELRNRNTMLQQKSNELRSMLSNMFDIQREQETNRLRARLHDVLSQKITLFQRWMQSDTLPTAAQIAELIRSMKEGIENDAPENLQEIFENIIANFCDIGIEMEVTGKLPSDDAAARAFVLIVREASTNAVRHGLATMISIAFSEDDFQYTMKIEDNGIGTTGNVVYGNGLRIMGERLSKLDGELIVDSSAIFTIHAIIPKEKNYDYDGYR